MNWTKRVCVAVVPTFFAKPRPRRSARAACGRLVMMVSVASAISFTAACDKPDPPSVPDNDPEAVVAALNEFRDTLLEGQTGPRTVLLPPLLPVRLGEVLSLSPCESEDPVYRGHENALERVGALPTIETQLDVRLEQNFVWKRSYGTEAKVNLKVVKPVLDAAFAYKDQQVDRIRFSLSVSSLRTTEVRQPVDLIDGYSDLLHANERKSRGDAIVVGVIRGAMRMEYELFSENDERITIDLPKFVNSIGMVDGSYTTGRVETMEASVLIESESGETIFAVTTAPIPGEDQDGQWVGMARNELCSAEGGPSFIEALGTSTTGDDLVRFRIEHSDGPPGGRAYFLEATNIANRSFFALQYGLRFRNAYGQILGDAGGLLLDFAAGATSPEGRLAIPSLSLPPIGEVSVEVTLHELSSGVDVTGDSFECRSDCMGKGFDCRRDCSETTHDCRVACLRDSECPDDCRIACQDHCDDDQDACESTCDGEQDTCEANCGM